MYPTTNSAPGYHMIPFGSPTFIAFHPFQGVGSPGAESNTIALTSSLLLFFSLYKRLMSWYVTVPPLLKRCTRTRLSSPAGSLSIAVTAGETCLRRVEVRVVVNHWARHG